jgi:hypothetical protein
MWLLALLHCDRPETAPTDGSSTTAADMPVLETPTVPAWVAAVAGDPPIESAYGPRVQAGNPDFHLGIDLLGARGEPVLAVASGVVHQVRIPDDGDESLFVMVEHTVPSYSWAGERFDRIYTSYHHLDRVDVVEGQVVSAGDALGAMGDSGGADEVHLHLELRLGTPCSLEFQLEEPESDCVTGWSPHVDPLMVYPTRDGGGLSIEVEGLELTVRAPAADPDIRRIEVDGQVVDFSAWIGVDASSEEARDDMDVGWAVIAPEPTVDERVLRFLLDREPSTAAAFDAHGRGIRF